MRILKTNPVLTIFNSYLVDSPQPSSISYLYNFGSLLGLSLVVQIITGIFLAMHFAGTAELAFSSAEHIMRDVNDGWLLRYTHANMASFFFVAVYLHIARGLYYGSYRSPRIGVWVIGTIIFFLMMATAFLGFKYSPIWHIYRYKSLILLLNTETLLLNTKSKFSQNFINKIPFSSFFSSNSFNPKNNNNKSSERLKIFLNKYALKPLMVYQNLESKDTYILIKKTLSGKSGIYMIINLVNDKFYIGSASSDRLYDRFMNHLIYKTGSDIVAKAVEKYGIGQFAFIIIEYCNPIISKNNSLILLNLETYYLQKYKPPYNILNIGGSSLGYKHTELTKEKMKTKYSEERRKFIGNLNKDKNIPEEIKEKMRSAAYLRPPMSEESKLKCITNNKPVIAYSLDRSINRKEDSMIKLANYLQVNQKTLRRAINNKRLIKNKWIIEYDKKVN